MKIIASLKISRIIFITTLIFLLFVAYLSYMRLQNLIEYAQLVDDSTNLKFKLEQCLSYMKDAETGQRGYLLTRDSLFLDPMYEAQKKIYHALDELSEMAKNDTEMLPAINEFKRRAIERLNFMIKVIHEDTRDKTYNGIAMGSLLHGKLLMDDTRRIVEKIQGDIENKLEKRQKVKDRYVTLTPLFMVVLSFLSIGLIYLAYLIIVNELKKRTIVQTDLEYNIEALKRSNEELEQFAYVASHDLQEPLRKIQTFGNRLMLKHRNELNEDGQHIIGRMQNAAQRMQVLINDLLGYSRIANASTKNFEWVDLNRLLANVLDTLSIEMQNKNARVRNDRLPSMNASPVQMEQLFQNLLTNAFKFVKESKSPVVDIKYSLASGKEIAGVKYLDIEKVFHKITFSDNGIGFEPQYADKIFVIFQRLQTKSEYKGTGIGLAMCKKIASNHDGYITAKSHLEKGSEFTVYLPKESFIGSGNTTITTNIF